MTANNTFKRGFKTEAEKKSIYYREILGIEKKAPLPANLLANHLNIRTLIPSDIFTKDSPTLSFLENSVEWSALTLLSKTGKRLIIHNEQHSKTRQESNIMHEIAHLLCEHSSPENAYPDGLNIFTRHYNEEQEKEAEWLGACLQLPREALLWALKRNMQESDISEYFNASKDMVKFRMNATGVVQQIKYITKAKHI